MFNQKEGGADIDTLIGPGSSIEGDIKFRDGLHVDGVVDGSIVAEGTGTLVVSDQGRVTGRIEVPRVVVDGNVEGDIVATEHLELRANARVAGNIEYGSIQMVLGAQVNGKLSSLGTSKAPSPAAKTE